jgi:aromatic-L-amino-acid decarboxylase
MAMMGDMPEAEWLEHGRWAVEWVARYLAHPERYPVLAQSQPGAVRGALPPAPPRGGEAMAAITADFERLILPGITHWNHPSFFAYFAITGSAPGILGELLSAALNVNGMLWKTSPAATELEETVMDWLRQMLGLPQGLFGIIMDTASVATLCAIAAAREAVAAHPFREEGMAGGPRLRLYTSEQAHSSVEKAAITLGLGRRGVRTIPVDREFRMDPAALRRAVADDRAGGWRPFCVVAFVGTTSTTSVDPVPAIADVCEAEGMWLHVDGAYAGMAAIAPEFRWALAGCERADSIVVNPHKWLFTPIDCSAVYCRRPEVLRGAFSLVPEYLRTTEAAQDGVHDLMNYGVQLGRRFRALKLWFIIRYFGWDGLAARIREHIRLGQEVARWVDADPNFERLAPTPFSTVCFRYRPPTLRGQAGEDERLDRLNSALLDAVNASGRAYLSHTRLEGRLALRMAIGNIRTTEAHVRDAWALIRSTGNRLPAVES